MASESDVFEWQKNGSLVITFGSTLQNVDRACRLAMAYLVEYLPEIRRIGFSVNLVMREALVNAVQHGNRNDPEKMVEFETTPGKKSFRFRIKDQGEGFDWQTEADRAYEEDFEHGRGLKIIEAYAFQYMFNDKGNTIYLEKILPF